MAKELPDIIKELHDKASYNKERFYIDPKTGLKVLTSYYLKQRAYCCSSACRHCPYKK